MAMDDPDGAGGAVVVGAGPAVVGGMVGGTVGGVVGGGEVGRAARRQVGVMISRGPVQQFKDQAQFDGWVRDGSAAAVEALCEWG